jgi:hypothetical protein
MAMASDGVLWRRRAISVGTSILLIGLADAALSSSVASLLLRSLAVSTQRAVMATATVCVFSLVGFCAGRLAFDGDRLPLAVVALITVVLILISVGIAAVENGAAQARWNSGVGLASLLVLTGGYSAAQRFIKRR